LNFFQKFLVAGLLCKQVGLGERERREYMQNQERLGSERQELFNLDGAEALQPLLRDFLKPSAIPIVHNFLLDSFQI
jgi:hypothetical protein